VVVVVVQWRVESWRCRCDDVGNGWEAGRMGRWEGMGEREEEGEAIQSKQSKC
jgi:hypothetical protein